jgi:hypothetical protein
MFDCVSSPTRQPRFVKHESGDPATAEHSLFHMEEADLLELFANSESLP